MYLCKLSSGRILELTIVMFCVYCVYVYVRVSTIVILSPLSDPFDLSHNLGTVVSVRSELSSGITVNSQPESP